MGFRQDTITQIVERRAVAAVGTLLVDSGPERGLSHELDIRPLVIGGSPEPHVVLSDRPVSRLHVSLRRVGDRIAVEDLGRKNGTWLGASRIERAEIDPDERLRIGRTVLAPELAERPRTEAVWNGGDRLGPLMGRSLPMQQLFARLVKVALRDSRLLIRGESGTGKDLVARSLHRLSPRADRPFVIVDGASLSSTLAGDELFGRVKGAYTGAHDERVGAFERADGGTLFIDEIGEMPLAVQRSLLRALDTGTAKRIGASEYVPVDVRVLAATHRPIERMVNARTFREDLFHRLAALEVTLPPLRERRDDIPLLAHALLDELPGVGKREHAELDRALADHASHPWPGNVRELRNFVQRVAILGGSDAGVWTVRSPPPSVRMDLPYAESRKRWIDRFEQEYVSRALDEAGGNVAEAARRCGVTREHLSKLAKRLGLRG